MSAAGGVAEASSSAIKVCVRVRPLVYQEIESGAQNVLKTFPETNQILYNNKKPFSFDKVFEQDSSQESVYNVCGSPLIDKIFSGYNATIFAYGQTGSGKTHTMGSEESVQTMDSDNRGLIPRLVDDIFAKAEQVEGSRFTFKCSMLEIYEEKVYDLFATARIALEIRDGPKGKGPVVVDLSEKPVDSLAATIRALEDGCQNRSRGQTAMNAQSSRSHAMFIMYLTQHSASGLVTHSKVSLIDLAGSERLKKTQAVGKRMQEGIKINSALLALGNVMNRLTDGSDGFVNYRDSSLTRLLQDSLGGNSWTVMIACVSPADCNADETDSTLMYAQRAKRIKNKPIVNQDVDALENQQLRERLEDLQRQLSEVESRRGQYGNFADSDEYKDYQLLKTELMPKVEKENSKLSKANLDLQCELAEAIDDKSGILEALSQAEERREQVEERIGLIRSRLSSEIEAISARLSQLTDCQKEIWLQELIEIQKLIDGVIKPVSDDEENRSRKRRSTEPDESGGDGEDDSANEEDLENFASNYHTRQKANTERYQAIIAELKQKVQERNSSVCDNVENESLKRKLANLQQQIGVSEKEKTELSQKLREVSTKTQMSEQRRQQIQELEKKIAEYKKQEATVRRLQAMKAASEAKAKELNGMIEKLKRTKVQLERAMKAEQKKYSQWKDQMNREINQLKQKERKGAVKAEMDSRKAEQQKRVLQQKYDQAVAKGKRLEDQLKNQETLKREKLDKIDSGRLAQELNKFLAQELSLVASREETKVHCEALMEQRASLTAEANKLKRRINKLEKVKARGDPPPAKKLNFESSAQSQENECDTAIEKYKEELVQLNAQIRDRNMNIRKMQEATASDSSVDPKAARWGAIHAHAKSALFQLFALACESKCELVRVEAALTDAKTARDELQSALAEREDELTRLKKETDKEKLKHGKENSRKEHESQVQASFLLSQIIGLMDGRDVEPAALDKIRQLQSSLTGLDNIDKLHIQLEKETKEKERLQKEISKASRSGKKINYFRSVCRENERDENGNDDDDGDLSTRDSDDFIPPSVPHKRRRQPVQRLGAVNTLARLRGDTDEESGSDDEFAADSDYRETPMHKRRTVSVIHSRGSSEDHSMPRMSMAAGRSVQCGCKTACNSRCGCKRAGRLCAEDCRCAVSKCTNRMMATSDSSQESLIGGKDPMNTTFQIDNSIGEQDCKENTTTLNATYDHPATSGFFSAGAQRTPRGGPLFKPVIQ